MEDEATQPGTTSSSILFAPQAPESQTYDPYYVATQVVIDPRRLGQGNSGLNDEDLADIFCILHPLTMPAYRAAARVHESDPQHTISSEHKVKIRENNRGGDLDVGTFDLAAQGLVACDIVLRLSADLKDSLGGYRFGRNAQRCDVVMGRDEEVKKISNIHFRIYINEHGIIMLEDQSTNGTVVDSALLRAKEKENGQEYRHTLEQGSIIDLNMTPQEENFKFIVRIPQRDDESEGAYQVNLTTYFLRMNNIKREREARAAAATTGGTREPLNLFPTPDDNSNPNQSMMAASRYVKEWKGGPKYNKVKCIGKGAFAVVYKVTDKFNGVPFAAKELEKRRFMKNGVLDQKVESEMNIMQRIKHPNIVSYVEHIDWEEYLYIIMEFIPGGDLGSHISENQHLPELTVKTMAVQLLGALRYLHGMQITHRDVKPDNILISSVEPFHVKLTDFGLSKMIDSEETFLRTFCGTLLYCAPEVYTEYREYDESGRRRHRGVDKKLLPPQRYGHAVDIWSLAGVLFYALCGSPPYPAKAGTSYLELLNHIMTQALDIRPLQRVGTSDNGIRFVRQMLHIRPQYRATILDLEASPWLTGGSMAMSIDEDEVDMIGNGFINDQLEGGTSQLSIHEHDGYHIASRQETGLDSVSDRTEMQPLEIPSSFETSEVLSIEDESYRFMPPNNPGNGRLFGELDSSALGSSGAVPLDQLNLPVPMVNHHKVPSNFSQESMYHESQESRNSSRMDISSQRVAAMPNIMPPPPPPHISESATKNFRADDHTLRNSSLMGADSLVGQMNMQSPSTLASPADGVSVAATTDAGETTVSLRRHREKVADDDMSWRPYDLPPKKRRRSEREIDMPVPPSIFWDPRDRSTHHNNYPRMSLSDFNAYGEYAESKGEKFEPGGKTFEFTMQSFRSSRSPSVEPETDTRARSEPTKEEGRRMMMKRDERNIHEDVVNQEGVAADAAQHLQDMLGPSTVNRSTAPMDGASQINTNPSNVLDKSHPVVGNDFQPPKRILAKLLATPDSSLPTLTFNITELFTSWGRASENTIHYSNATEIRIPKNAFKLLLFRPQFYSSEARSGFNPNRTSRQWKNSTSNDADQDMTFYISSKASTGIWINGINLPSVASTKLHSSSMESKFWGELRHGDIITVWQHDWDVRQFTRFKFECYWGNSKEARKEGEVFERLQEGHLLAEVERVSLEEEKKMSDYRKRQKEEDRKILEIEKAKEKRDREDAATRSHQSIGLALPRSK